SMRLPTFAFAVPTAALALVAAALALAAVWTTACSALAAVFFAVFTTLPVRSATVLPMSFAVTARAPAALLRVPLTRLPLLMGWSSSGAAGAGVGRARGRWSEGSGWSVATCAPTPALPGGGGSKAGSELAVVTLFQGVEQVGGGVGLAVVFDLFVALDLDRAAVVELEAVGGVGQVRVL